MSTTLTTRVEKIERLDNSKYGNPVYRITTPSGTWRTKAESQAGYDAGSLEEGDVVELLVEQAADATTAGQISRVKRVDA